VVPVVAVEEEEDGAVVATAATVVDQSANVNDDGGDTTTAPVFVEAIPVVVEATTSEGIGGRGTLSRSPTHGYLSGDMSTI
jgi:hypothetical protein